MMKLLDLFCGTGGASMGYCQAGFSEIIGVDLNPQPNYPFNFVQADAIAFLKRYGKGFDFIHASPPCQRFSIITPRKHRKKHKDLIVPVRSLLKATGKPYVIENVVGADLVNPTMLCGTMFGLKVYRHRLFESSFSLLQPSHYSHQDSSPGCNGNRISPKGFVTVVGGGFNLKYAQWAMGINWMSSKELCQAIPPAYTRFVGQEFTKGNIVR